MKIFDWIVDLAAILAAILLCCMMLIVCLGILARYFLGHPLFWVTGISEALLLYVTFLAATWVLRREKHVKMDLLINRLNAKHQACLNVITSTIFAFSCLVVIWYSVRVTWSHYQLGKYTQDIMRMPYAALLVIIPIGTALLFGQCLKTTSGFLKSWKGTINPEGLSGEISTEEKPCRELRNKEKE